MKLKDWNPDWPEGFAIVYQFYVTKDDKGNTVPLGAIEYHEAKSLYADWDIVAVIEDERKHEVVIKKGN